MMGWPFLHPDFLRWTVDMYFKKNKKKRNTRNTLSPGTHFVEGNRQKTEGTCYP